MLICALYIVPHSFVFKIFYFNKNVKHDELLKRKIKTANDFTSYIIMTKAE